jgi:hypothetical protein
MNSVTFSQIVDGYLLAANARHLSPHIIRDYITTFKKFLLISLITISPSIQYRFNRWKIF